MVQLSVCMTTHNHEKYIMQAIQSVLTQDADFEFEIVVGEDCSVDKTASILRELEPENRSRMRVVYRPTNLGIPANFLNTLAECSGEYIAFLEGDDYWTSSDKLRLQVDFLNNNRRAVCVFHRTRAVKDESIEDVFPEEDPPEFFSLDFLLRNNVNHFHISSLVARRECLGNIDSWLEGIRPADWPLYMMLATRGDLGFIPREMSHYRRHVAGNWTRLSDHRRAAMVVRMLTHVLGLVSSDHQQLVDSVRSHYANLWLSSFVVHHQVSPEVVVKDLLEMPDLQLSSYLLEQVVAVARAKEAALSACMTALDRERSEVADLRDRLASSEVQVKSKDELIDKIRASTSWRVTAPLRAVKSSMMRQPD